MPAENRTYEAVWQINTYTIEFDTAGGSAISSITQNFDTALTLPDDPKKDGYIFTGWTRGGKPETLPERMPAAGAVLCMFL